jgi:hypothetical protein
MRSHPLASLVLAATFALPSIAHADLRLGGSGERVERKGFMMGLSLLPGITRSAKSFAPTMRVRWALGGGVHEAVTLATEFGVHKPFGIKSKKIAFEADVVATGFIGRFFVRGGVGVTSWAYVAAPSSQARLDPYKPGVGGLVGVGWEFPMGERVGLGLGLDYDARVRSDGRVAQTVLFGLRLNGYLKK